MSLILHMELFSTWLPRPPSCKKSLAKRVLAMSRKVWPQSPRRHGRPKISGAGRASATSLEPQCHKALGHVKIPMLDLSFTDVDFCMGGFSTTTLWIRAAVDCFVPKLLTLRWKVSRNRSMRAARLPLPKASASIIEHNVLQLIQRWFLSPATQTIMSHERPSTQAVPA